MNKVKMVRILCNALVIITLGTILSLGLARKTFAKNNSQSANSGLLIYPELPKNNIGGKGLGFFNIKATSKEQHFRIKLYNPTNYRLKVNSKVVDATTDDDGIPNYTGSQKINSKLLKDPGSQYITITDSITLSPNSERWLNISVKPFSKIFGGRKAAAVVLTTEDTGRSQKSSITNRYIYAIEITLNGKKIEKKSLRKATVSKVKTRFIGKSAYISTLIKNQDPIYLKKSHIKIQLTNTLWHMFKYQYDKKNMEVTPSSDFWANLPLKGQRLVPGDYKMRVSITNNQYTKVINKGVKITKHEAYLINKNNEQWLKVRNVIICSSIVVLILASVGTVLIIRKRNR